MSMHFPTHSMLTHGGYLSPSESSPDAGEVAATDRSRMYPTDILESIEGQVDLDKISFEQLGAFFRLEAIEKEIVPCITAFKGQLKAVLDAAIAKDGDHGHEKLKAIIRDIQEILSRADSCFVMREFFSNYKAFRTTFIEYLTDKGYLDLEAGSFTNHRFAEILHCCRSDSPFTPDLETSLGQAQDVLMDRLYEARALRKITFSNHFHYRGALSNQHLYLDYLNPLPKGYESGTYKATNGLEIHKKNLFPAGAWIQVIINKLKEEGKIAADANPTIEEVFAFFYDRQPAERPITQSGLTADRIDKLWEAEAAEEAYAQKLDEIDTYLKELILKEPRLITRVDPHEDTYDKINEFLVAGGARFKKFFTCKALQDLLNEVKVHCDEYISDSGIAARLEQLVDELEEVADQFIKARVEAGIDAKEGDKSRPNHGVGIHSDGFRYVKSIHIIACLQQAMGLDPTGKSREDQIQDMKDKLSGSPLRPEPSRRRVSSASRSSSGDSVSSASRSRSADSGTPPRVGVRVSPLRGKREGHDPDIDARRDSMGSAALRSDAAARIGFSHLRTQSREDNLRYEFDRVNHKVIITRLQDGEPIEVKEFEVSFIEFRDPDTGEELTLSSKLTDPQWAKLESHVITAAKAAKLFGETEFTVVEAYEEDTRSRVPTYRAEKFVKGEPRGPIGSEWAKGLQSAMEEWGPAVFRPESGKYAKFPDYEDAGIVNADKNLKPITLMISTLLREIEEHLKGSLPEKLMQLLRFSTERGILAEFMAGGQMTPQKTQDWALALKDLELLGISDVEQLLKKLGFTEKQITGDDLVDGGVKSLLEAEDFGLEHIDTNFADGVHAYQAEPLLPSAPRRRERHLREGDLRSSPRSDSGDSMESSNSDDSYEGGESEWGSLAPGRTPLGATRREPARSPSGSSRSTFASTEASLDSLGGISAEGSVLLGSEFSQEKAFGKYLQQVIGQVYIEEAEESGIPSRRVTVAGSPVDLPRGHLGAVHAARSAMFADMALRMYDEISAERGGDGDWNRGVGQETPRRVIQLCAAMIGSGRGPDGRLDLEKSKAKVLALLEASGIRDQKIINEVKAAFAFLGRDIHGGEGLRHCPSELAAILHDVHLLEQSFVDNPYGGKKDTTFDPRKLIFVQERLQLAQEVETGSIAAASGKDAASIRRETRELMVEIKDFIGLTEDGELQARLHERLEEGSFDDMGGFVGDLYSVFAYMHDKFAMQARTGAGPETRPLFRQMYALLAKDAGEDLSVLSAYTADKAGKKRDNTTTATPDRKYMDERKMAVLRERLKALGKAQVQTGERVTEPGLGRRAQRWVLPVHGLAPRPGGSQFTKAPKIETYNTDGSRRFRPKEVDVQLNHHDNPLGGSVADHDFAYRIRGAVPPTTLEKRMGMEPLEESEFEFDMQELIHDTHDFIRRLKKRLEDAGVDTSTLAIETMLKRIDKYVFYLGGEDALKLIRSTDEVTDADIDGLEDCAQGGFLEKLYDKGLESGVPAETRQGIFLDASRKVSEVLEKLNEVVAQVIRVKEGAPSTSLNDRLLSDANVAALNTYRSPYLVPVRGRATRFVASSGGMNRLTYQEGLDFIKEQFEEYYFVCRRLQKEALDKAALLNGGTITADDEEKIKTAFDGIYLQLQALLSDTRDGSPGNGILRQFFNADTAGDTERGELRDQLKLIYDQVETLVGQFKDYVARFIASDRNPSESPIADEFTLEEHKIKIPKTIRDAIKAEVIVSVSGPHADITLEQIIAEAT